MHQYSLIQSLKCVDLRLKMLAKIHLSDEVMTSTSPLQNIIVRSSVQQIALFMLMKTLCTLFFLK